MNLNRRRYGWAAVTALALLLLCVQSVRVWRASPLERFWNFGYIHLGALCLADRCDPFDAAALNVEWKRRGEPWVEDLFVEYPVYPPSTLALAVPLNRLGWPGSAEVYTWCSVMTLAAAVCLLCWRMRVERWAAGGALLLATLGTKFLYDALWVANPVVPGCALVLLACLQLMEDGGSVAGVAMLALALCVKPQLAVGALVFFLWRRRSRRSAVWAGSVWVVVLGAASAAYVVRLGSWHVLHQFAHVVKIGLQPGHSSDASRVHGVTDYLNLETVTTRITALSVRADKRLAVGITGLLALAAWWAGRRNGVVLRRPWGVLGLVMLVSLMPVYHRDYDRLLALLLVPVAVEMGRVQRAAGWVFAVAAVMWVQTGWIAKHVLPVSAAWPMNALLVALLAVGLLWSVWQSGAGAGQAGVASLQ